MGGVGSGTWYRWDKKTTLEETRRIDIRFMKKRGLLSPGSRGTFQWSREGEHAGDVGFHCHQDSLQINYRYRGESNDWQSIEQCIHFERTPCNYGGERQWFLCPECYKRVAVLSGYGKYFLCRHCYQLPYASQQEGALDRFFR